MQLIGIDLAKREYEWHIRTRKRGIKGSKVKYKVVAATEDQAVKQLTQKLSAKNIVFLRTNTTIVSVKQGKEVKT